MQRTPIKSDQSKISSFGQALRKISFEPEDKKQQYGSGEKCKTSKGQRTSRFEKNYDYKEQNKSGVSSTSRVTFNMNTSQKQENEDYENLKKFKKDPKQVNLKKQNSIDPEILNSYDEKSISDYFGTLSHIKEFQTPIMRTLNTNVQLDSLFHRKEEKNQAVISPQKAVTPIKQIRLNPTTITSKANVQLRYNTIQEWEQIQANNRLHNKKITPRNRCEYSYVERLDSSQTERKQSINRAQQQKIKDSSSQIVTLPGGSNYYSCQSEIKNGTYRDESPNQIIYNNYLKTQDETKRSASKSRKNDSSNVNSIMSSPKNSNNIPEKNQFSFQANLFSKFLKSVSNQSNKIQDEQKQETYISMYKQDYKPKTKRIDLELQNQQFKKKLNTLTSRTSNYSNLDQPKENILEDQSKINKIKDKKNISTLEIKIQEHNYSSQAYSHQKILQNTINNSTISLNTQKLEQSMQFNGMKNHA